MIENSNSPIYFHPFFSKKYKRFERGAYYCFWTESEFLRFVHLVKKYTTYRAGYAQNYSKFIIL